VPPWPGFFSRWRRPGRVLKLAMSSAGRHWYRWGLPGDRALERWLVRLGDKAPASFGISERAFDDRRQTEKEPGGTPGPTWPEGRDPSGRRPRPRRDVRSTSSSFQRGDSRIRRGLTAANSCHHKRRSPLNEVLSQGCERVEEVGSSTSRRRRRSPAVEGRLASASAAPRSSWRRP
jgi:hypothetical protein